MNEKDQRSTTTGSFPPRRIKHQRKKARRKRHLKEADSEYLSSSSIETDDKGEESVLERADKEVAASEVKKKFNGGLIFANIVLWFFLLMVGFILFYVVTK